MKRFPENSRHPAYFVPTAFLFYVATLALVWASLPFWTATKGAWMTAVLALWIYTAPFALYLLATGLSTFSFNPARWLLVWAGVFATHLCYGLRFIQGLCATRAPCEYIGKDHA